MIRTEGTERFEAQFLLLRTERNNGVKGGTGNQLNRVFHAVAFNYGHKTPNSKFENLYQNFNCNSQLHINARRPKFEKLYQ